MARYQKEEVPDEQRCQAETSKEGSGYNRSWTVPHRCPRHYAEELNGKRYCRQHAKMQKR